MSSEPYDKNFPFKDNPAVTETFADGIHMITAGNAVLKIDLTVSRGDPPKTGNKAPTGSKVIASRIVMPVTCIADLYNQLDSLVKLMEQQGLLTRHGGGVAPTLQ